jgi:hypothetical protein
MEQQQFEVSFAQPFSALTISFFHVARAFFLTV